MMVSSISQRLVPWISQNVLRLCALCLLIIVPSMLYLNAYIVYMKQGPGLTMLSGPSSFAQKAYQISTGPVNMLDGCYHVYLDVGSNIGIQVRKLYEPEKYPDAPFIRLFEDYFGNMTHRRQQNNHWAAADTVCAVGFEPNPHHTKILTGTENLKYSCKKSCWVLL